MASYVATCSSAATCKITVQHFPFTLFKSSKCVQILLTAAKKINILTF